MKQRHAIAVGLRIRELREALGFSTEDLGQEIGTDKGTISRLERAEAGLSHDRALLIAKALGVEVEHLNPERFPTIEDVERDLEHQRDLERRRRARSGHRTACAAA